MRGKDSAIGSEFCESTTTMSSNPRALTSSIQRQIATLKVAVFRIAVIFLLTMFSQAQVLRAQDLTCTGNPSCSGIIWEWVGPPTLDITCETNCSNQYSACLGDVALDVIGGAQCCAAQYQACLCDCPPPNADTGTPGPACPACSLDSPAVADPVDAASGLFLYDHTDLELKDVMPIEISRSYRELDEQSRAFGIGMALDYDLTIIVDESTSVVVSNGNQYTVPNYAYADLILPNGRRVYYARISSGNYFEGAQFQNTNFPGEYFGSILTASGSGWVLALKDGTKMTFANHSLLTLITDRNGNRVEISRDFNNLYVTGVTSPNGRWISFSYDSSNRITQAQDNAGRTVSYSYNSNGRLNQYTDANGGITSYAYDSNGRMYTITDPRGKVFVTNNQYDSSNRVILQTDADNATYQLSYPTGSVNTTEYTDPNGYVRHMEFNSAGFLTKDVLAQGDPEQETTTYDRDPNTNLVQSKTDPLGRVTTYSYDALGNTTGVTQLEETSQPVTTSYTYDPNFSQITSITNPLGYSWTFSLDGNGNVQTITDPLGHQTTENHDTEGNLISYADGVGDTTHFAYTNGDLTSITDPLGNTSYLFDDAVGRTIWTEDPLGNQTNLSYSPLDDLTQSMDPLGGLTNFTYDGDSNLISVTDANGGATTYTYDPMNRKASRIDPLSASETYGYDGNGNLTGHTDRRGKVTVYQYDGINRRKFAGFGYTSGSYESTSSYQFDLGDRITQIVDSIAGTTVRQYDGLDDLTDEQTAQGEVGYSYDNARRRQTMTVVGQPAVSYSWDNANRLTGITQGSTSIPIAYDNADRRTTLTVPNGIVLTYTHDADSHVTGMTWTLAGNPLGDLEYGYDADGRVIQKTGSFAQTGLPQPVTGNTFNAANEMTAFNGTPMSYDANGNLTNDGTNTYSWDARNHLTAIAGPNTASFAYDADGRRAQKTINGVSTQFLYDGLNPVQEIQNGAPSANLLTGLGVDEYFQRTDSAGARNYMTDILGSTLALTDSSGNIQTSYTYDPFGNTGTSGQASANPYQFTGRENDGTGVLYYRARYYDPTLERFISQDPLGFGSQNVNLYAYVEDSPIDLLDPLGLFWWDVHCVIATIEVANGRTGTYGGNTSTDPFVALPGPNLRGAQVEVCYNGNCVIAPVGDKGPWYPDDPYWSTPLQIPRAANREHTCRPNNGKYGDQVPNGAGIDISQPLANELGITGTTTVCWQGL
jgi:RHS repeat-associated protein